MYPRDVHLLWQGMADESRKEVWSSKHVLHLQLSLLLLGVIAVHEKNPATAALAEYAIMVNARLPGLIHGVYANGSALVGDFDLAKLRQRDPREGERWRAEGPDSNPQ